MSKRCLIAVVAAVLLTGMGIASAKSPSPPPSSGGNESADQNVRESEQYERLLCTNPAFRARRVAQECGPLKDSQFYQSCVDSFQCNAGRQRGSQFRKAPPSERVQ